MRYSRVFSLYSPDLNYGPSYMVFLGCPFALLFLPLLYPRKITHIEPGFSSKFTVIGNFWRMV
jgi:hypothetical protein